MITKEALGSLVEVVQKGTMIAEITTYGKPVNSSVVNYVGENAVHAMVRILNRMSELCALKVEYPSEEQQLMDCSKDLIKDSFGALEAERAVEHVKVNIVSFDGGLSKTMIPEICKAKIDVLTPTAMPIKTVQDKLESIAAEACPQGADIKYIHGIDGTDVNTKAPVASVLKHADDLLGFKD